MPDKTRAIGGFTAPRGGRREDRTTSPAEFGTVDASADPGGLIRFLDAANAVSGLRAAKDALLEQLALGRARTALDVGCGAGGDLAEMARLMPDGTHVSGVDASETMIAEARRRTTSLGTRVRLQVGDAAGLPYDDQGFDACRAATVLQHVPEPARVLSEMARVTRPGGRVGALEFDQETLFVDHPDPETTRIILDTFASAMVQGHIGRQLPRLFRAAGLTEVSVTPRVILGTAQFLQTLLHDHVARLQGQGLLTGQRAAQWWAELNARAQAGDFAGGVIVFVVTASRPGHGPDRIEDRRS
jgi:ubiquinone/menaquinone biosynthesis C-methylase UbiE